MNRPPVLTKEDFSVRYGAGEFGNASPTWHTRSAFWASGADCSSCDGDGYVPCEDSSTGYAVCGKCGNDLFHLRNRVAAGDTFYNMNRANTLDAWKRQPYPELWYCSAMCPTERTILQGEVLQGNYGLDRSGGAGLELYYTTIAKPMREALSIEAKAARGLFASHLLQIVMDANSWEWLNELLVMYPGHVVEFTTLDTCWGTLPGFNTLFWEVRNY